MIKMDKRGEAEAPPPYYPDQQEASRAAPVSYSVPQTVVVVHTPGPTESPDPVHMPCPHCSAQITTIVEYENGCCTFLTAGMIAFFGCILGCCLIPFWVDELKDVRHVCPECNRVIGTYHRYEQMATRRRRYY